MDFSEKWGTDVETAVKLALDDLKLTRDEVDVTVLEEPSRGFFGIGSKLALVRVEKKKAAPAPAPVVEEKKEEIPAVKTVTEEPKSEKVQNNRKHKEHREKTGSQKHNNKRDRNNNRSKKEHKNREKVEMIESLEPVIERVPEEDLSVCENHIALEFLAEVTEQMGLSLDITAKEGGESLYIDIQGKDSGTIIGKRGQTLDAIQYLTSLVVNKDQENYTRVVVDAENYRAKREKTLEMLAIRLANKVAKSKKSVKLEPMNPYERKVIHATLQNHPHVTTKSEGQDPYRRVIIELK
jgi:spoIIIJ-associated protein